MEVLFCMTISYLKSKFYQNVGKDAYKAKEYSNATSNVFYIKRIIDLNTLGCDL